MAVFARASHRPIPDRLWKRLVGKDVANLSGAVVGKLKRRWADEYATWGKADLSKERWVYLWADGIYSGIRAEDQKLCALIVIGVNERGQKRFLAIEDGVRESKQSWREVLIGLKARGLVAPEGGDRRRRAGILGCHR